MINKVCILADKHDWHSSELSSSFKKKCIDVNKIKFEDLNFKVSDSKLLIFHKNSIFDYDGVWVRYINGGTIEEITFKLSILHLIKLSGIYVHNSADIIEKTIDKFRTSSILALNKILTPKTIIKQKIGGGKNFYKLLKESNYLHKPILGSQGKGIISFKNIFEFRTKPIPNSIVYFQQFLGDLDDRDFRDIRILVSNHKLIVGVERKSKQFLTNVSMGGKVKQIKPDTKMNKLSKEISKLFELGYGGLDLKYFENKVYVLEVNSIPSWKATQKVTKQNIADLLVKDFVHLCQYEKKKFLSLS